MTVWAIFAASLLGSPHCAAMCGVIAAGAGTSWSAAAAYHGARLAGYLLIGAAVGGLGAAVDLTGAWLRGTEIAAVVAGIGLIVFGAGSMLATAGIRVPGIQVGHSMARSLSRIAAKRSGLTRAALFGAATAILPCGWLGAFALTALATADPLAGAGAMAVFWLGTIPGVAGAGFLLSRLSIPVRRRLPLVTGAVLIVFGALTAVGRTHHWIPGPAAAHAHGR